MKQLLFLFPLVTLLLSACSSYKSPDTTTTEVPAIATPDNSRNSLDWQGIYRGTLPCADCEGIKTEIELYQDLTYKMASLYLGKSDEIFREKGTFTWNKNGGNITLEGGQAPETQQYQVGENMLRKLDTSGQRITGDLAENYILKKAGTDQAITEKYWKLIELKGKKMGPAENQRREPHFILKAENNRVTGNSGCNSFSGTYELTTGNRIRFNPIASTKMFCPGTDHEQDYLQVFDATDNYSLKGDTLSLNKARMAPLARFVEVFLR